jgi:hypothetical protein
MSAINTMFQYMIALLEHKFHPILTWDTRRLSPLLANFSAAIREASPLANTIGFVDGTRRQHTKPGVNQRESFNHHHWFHCLGFQGVSTPDGIIVQISPGMPGSYNDQFLLHASALNDIMSLQPFSNYFVYADAGYTTKDHVIAPFARHDGVTAGELAFNAQMSSARVTIEWLFGRVVQLWRFLQHDDDLMVLKSSLSTYYRVAVLLTNVRTCLDGRNQVADYFSVEPPTLEDYLYTALHIQ